MQDSIKAFSLLLLLFSVYFSVVAGALPAEVVAACPCEGPPEGGDWTSHQEYVCCVIEAVGGGNIFRKSGSKISCGSSSRSASRSSSRSSSQSASQSASRRSSQSSSRSSSGMESKSSKKKKMGMINRKKNMGKTGGRMLKSKKYKRKERKRYVDYAIRSECGKPADGVDTDSPTGSPVAPGQSVLVQTFNEDPTNPAEAGVLIFVDGVLSGATEADGSFELNLLSSETPYTIRAVDPGIVGGRQEVVVTNEMPTEPLGVSIVMVGDGGLAEDTKLVIDPVADGGIIDSSFTQLSLRFEFSETGEMAPLNAFDNVFVFPVASPENFQSVTELFVLEEGGRIVLNDIEAFRAVLTGLPFGEAAIRLDGDDADGRTYVGRATFYLGSSSVTGTLQAPPSNTVLPVSGLTVLATYLVDSSVSAVSTSNADGTFAFAGLPPGNWELTMTTTDTGGLIYNGFATIIILPGNSVSLTITLRTTEDVLNNVPPFVVLGNRRHLSSLRGREQSLRAKDTQSNEPPPQLRQDQRRTQSSASVFVSAGSENFAVLASDSLLIPQGTQTVTLKYTVSSAEYPNFVLSQSIYNDIWTLVVTGSSGQQLFGISRQVNSMIFVQPFFQSNGSTGLITETLDVSGLTQTADATIVLAASSTNIGDAALTTTVDASVDFSPELVISEIKNDKVVPTIGDSSFYSIPRSGESNTFARKYTLKITKPEMSVITKVIATLKTSSGTELMKLVDEAPGGSLVTEIDDETIEVVITNTNSNKSTLTSTPPTVHNIVHEFTIEGELDGSPLPSDTKSSNPRKALWVLPNSITRKPARDTGGDGWCQKGAYLWMETNKALLPRVDDVSGEHGRDIGHSSSHQDGRHMDTFHFTDLTGGTFHGTTNYKNLRAKVIDALGGDMAANTTVVGWMNEARTGLKNLADNDAVAQLIYHKGKAFDVLPSGWAKDLLLDGKVTSTGGDELDLAIGDWSNSKVIYNNVHNNHLHIDLKESKLDNSG